ncbi:MAG: hypothetical protein ABIF40_03140 [archaeon]
MKKKGSLWVSAVLYLALGLVVLTLVLTAGMPMISKMKDKNTVAQTKEIFYTLNENILEVVSEGPGSKRVLSPFEIKAGEFNIDSINSKIIWQMTTTNELLEPGIEITEGPFKMLLSETNIVDEYELQLAMSYEDTTVLSDTSDILGPYSGRYTLTVTRTGWDTNLELPSIEIKLTG